MPHKYHRLAASFTLALTILAMICFQILSSYVPYVASLWAAEEAPIAGWQAMLIHASEFVVAHKPALFILLPVLFFMALLWHGVLWLLTLQATKKSASQGN